MEGVEIHCQNIVYDCLTQSTRKSRSGWRGLGSDWSVE